jgi:hypothetical protein
MAGSFDILVKQVLAEQGGAKPEALLDSPVKFKAFLSDYAKGQFSGEIRIFTEMLKEDYKNVLLNNTNDPDIAKKQLVSRIRLDFLADEAHAKLLADAFSSCYGFETSAAPITDYINSLPDIVLESIHNVIMANNRMNLS